MAIIITHYFLVHSTLCCVDFSWNINARNLLAIGYFITTAPLICRYMIPAPIIYHFFFHSSVEHHQSSRFASRPAQLFLAFLCLSKVHCKQTTFFHSSCAFCLPSHFLSNFWMFEYTGMSRVSQIFRLLHHHHKQHSCLIFAFFPSLYLVFSSIFRRGKFVGCWCELTSLSIAVCARLSIALVSVAQASLTLLPPPIFAVRFLPFVISFLSRRSPAFFGYFHVYLITLILPGNWIINL